MKVDLLSNSQNALSQLTYATSVASENINNASNPNYSRLIVMFSTNGAGVATANPIRMSNAYLVQQLYDGNEQVSYNKTVYKMANSVDSIITGISADSDGNSSNALQQGLNAVNEALVNLVTDDSYAARSSLLTRLDSFLSTASTMTEQLNTFEEQLNNELSYCAEQINKQASQLSKLNKQLLKTPNEPSLLTQRDQLLSEISNLVAIDVQSSDSGVVAISVVGGHELVHGNKTTPIVAKKDDLGQTQLYLHGSRITSNPEQLGGALGGTVSALEDIVKETERMVSKLLVGIMTELNNLNKDGYKADGTNGTTLINVPSCKGVASSMNVGTGEVSMSIDSENISNLTSGVVSMTKTGGMYEFYNDLTDEKIITNSLPAEVFGYCIEGAGVINEGDTFTLAPLGEMMKNMSVVGTSQDIAAAGSTPVKAGDNKNLANLSNIISSTIFNGGDNVVTELGNIFISIGNNTVSAEHNLKTSSSLHDVAQNNWSDYSGVSTQEEELNMLKYQQVYNSVSKVIQASNEMFDTLLSTI